MVDVAIRQLGFKLQDELLDHLGDNLRRQMRKGDDGIEPVAEFRREQPVDRLGVIAFPLLAGEAIGGLRHVGGARVRGHDQDHVAEIDLLAVVVGELAVVHDLQQHVEQIRMRLLDLVEQQHAVRMLVDAVGSRPPWSKPT